MFTVLARIRNHEDSGAWITCLWLAACVIMPFITILWSLVSSYGSWFWEAMCIITWVGLFWWTGGSRAKEPAAYDTEAIDRDGEEDQTGNTFEKDISR
jgi:hypothetical protein